MMLGSRIIYNFYNFSKNTICSSYGFIKNLPSLYRTKSNEFRNYLADFRYKLRHLTNTNYNLGLYHLHHQNLNDAIIRFKLIDKFLNPGDPKANYLLGWCYFLKNNTEKAIQHLNKAKLEDKAKLGVFLENYNKYTDIPDEVWSNYRDLTAEKYTTKFYSDIVHLPNSFIQETLNSITDIPNHYSILELGANVGLSGYEIDKRFPDTFTLVGVENSEKMLELIDIYYPNYNIYDKLIHSSIKVFLNETKDKFDVVLSFCGLVFTKDLMNYLKLIHNLLNDKGYFAFCLPSDKNTEFSLERKEFIYNPNEIKNLISTSNIFTLLSSNDLILRENNKYSIFVCRKV